MGQEQLSDFIQAIRKYTDDQEFRQLLPESMKNVVFDIHSQLSVRAHVGPGGVLVRVFVRVVGELAGGYVIVKTVFYELARSVSGAVAFLRLGLEVPLEVFVVLEFQVQRQVLGVVGVTGDFRYLTRQFLQVKELFLAARGGVHHVVAGAVGRFPAVPELVRVPEPVGTDFGGVHHIAQALGREAGGLLIIGRLGRCGNAQAQRYGDKKTFHTIQTNLLLKVRNNCDIVCILSPKSASLSAERVRGKVYFLFFPIYCKKVEMQGEVCNNCFAKCVNVFIFVSKMILFVKL